MGDEVFEFEIAGVNRAEAGLLAGELADRLIEIDSVTNVERVKGDSSTMDIGDIIRVVVESGAALALAKGLADWLRARSGAIVVFGRSGKGEPTATIRGVDGATAERMLDMLLKHRRR
jgi:Effector Associated Constant Component 1